MTQASATPRHRRSMWRLIGWGFAAAALLAPAIAMQFTTEVNWTASDFVTVATMFLVAGGAIELSVRMIHSGLTRRLVLIVIIGAFLWLWAELAVGVFTDWGS